MTNTTHKSQTRRDRRKAKEPGYAREPNPAGKVGHHLSIPKFHKGARVRVR